MLDIAMIVAVGRVASDPEPLLPPLLLVPVLLLTFFVLVPVATAFVGADPGRGAPVTWTLRVHTATGLTRLQTPERVVGLAAALFT